MIKYSPSKLLYLNIYMKLFSKFSYMSIRFLLNNNNKKIIKSKQFGNNGNTDIIKLNEITTNIDTTKYIDTKKYISVGKNDKIEKATNTNNIINYNNNKNKLLEARKLERQIVIQNKYKQPIKLSNNQNIENSKNNLIVTPMYGLGNRLRVLASCYSICKEKKINLIINWIQDNHCDCSIHDLFKNIDDIGFVINDKVNIDELKKNNYKIYNYIETDINGKNNEFINFDNIREVYVKSNCIINSKYSFTHYNSFFKNLLFSDDVNKLINSVDTKDCIGMHIRMEGGREYCNTSYDNYKNWTEEETKLMFENRDRSHIDYFINQINTILKKDSNKKFFIATDMKINYDKLIKIYGNEKITILNRDLFDRSSNQIKYSLSDIILLSKCNEFYGSSWSSFSEIVIAFQCRYHNNKVMNMLSNDFPRDSVVINSDKIDLFSLKNDNIFNDKKCYQSYKKLVDEYEKMNEKFNNFNLILKINIYCLLENIELDLLFGDNQNLKKFVLNKVFTEKEINDELEVSIKDFYNNKKFINNKYLCNIGYYLINRNVQNININVDLFNKIKNIIDLKAKNNKVLVIGNGPSAKDFKFDDYESIVKHTTNKTTFYEITLTMNNFYRYSEKINWYSNIYVSLDVVVTESNVQKIKEMIDNKKHELYYLDDIFLKFYPEYKDNEIIVFRSELKDIDITFSDESLVTTGSDSVRLMLICNFYNINIIGIDCNYKRENNQLIDGMEVIKTTHNIIEVKEDINNPNYFFEGYNVKGDRLNFPDCRLNENLQKYGNDLHYLSWVQLVEAIKRFNENNYKKVSVESLSKNSRINDLLNKDSKIVYKIISKNDEKIIINKEIKIELKNNDLLEIYYCKYKYNLIINKKLENIFEHLDNIEYINNNTFELSIVIPFSIKNLNKESEENFKYTFNEYLKIVKKENLKVQLCLIHTEKEYDNFIDDIFVNNDVNYIFVKNPYNFNLGYCRNLWKYVCNSSKIMFNDIDIPLKENHVIDLIKSSKEYDIVKPYDRNIIHTNSNERTEYIDKNIIPNKNPKGLFSITGGITLFDKKMLLETGGYEEFNGHGYEDRCLDVIVLNNKYTIKKLDNKIVHLYHPEITFVGDTFNSINKEFYNCTINLDSKNDIHEKCNHFKDTNDISNFNSKYNGNLKLFLDGNYQTINLKKVYSKNSNLSTISNCNLYDNIDMEEFSDFKINSLLKDFTITLLGYNQIKNDGSRHTNWFPWNRFKDVYETIGYKCEWTSLEKLERKDEKRLFITWNEPTSLELYQSGKINKEDIIFQKLTSLGKGMNDINWTENPKKWCEEWHWPVYRTVEYLYDLGLNIYGFGCQTDINLFPEKKRICEKLKDRIFWITGGGTPFNWEQIKNCKPINDNLKKDISFVGSKWGKVGRGNKDAWEKYIEPFESENCQYKFNKYGGIGNTMVSDDEMVKLLQKSKICPIMHTPSWQAERGIQDRFYTVFLSGRFDICDNLGAVDIFGNEIKDICTEDPKEYYQKSIYYLEHPEEQLKYIEIIQRKIKEKFNFYKQWENVFNSIDFNLNNITKYEKIINEIKTPYIEYLTKQQLCSKNYCYINEIFYCKNKENYYNYFIYKICKNLNINDNISLEELINSKKFIQEYHETTISINENFKKCLEFCKFNKFNFYLKYDINKKFINYYSNNVDLCSPITSLEKDDKIHNSDKLFTFVCIVKNRPNRTNISVNSLVNYENFKYCNFIVIEDKSENINNFENFKYKHLIDHYVVNTNITWTRSGLLNYGIKKAKTPYIVAWDCDFLFRNQHIIDINIFLEKYKPLNIIGVNSYETFFSSLDNPVNFPCVPYGYLWIYNKRIIESVNYFDMKMIGHGFEEIELEKRIFNKYGLVRIKTDDIYPIIHLSHNCDIRQKHDVNNPNKDIYLNTTRLKLQTLENNNFDFKLIKFSSYNLISGDIIKFDSKYYQVLIDDEYKKMCIYDLNNNKLYIKEGKLVFTASNNFYFNFKIIEKKLLISKDKYYLNLEEFKLENLEFKNKIYNVGNENKLYDNICSKLKINNFNNYILKDDVKILGPAECNEVDNNFKLNSNYKTCICNTSIKLLGNENFTSKVDIYFHCVSTHKENGDCIDVDKLIKYQCKDIVFVYPFLEFNSDSTFRNIGTLKVYIKLCEYDFKSLNLWVIDKDYYLNLEKNIKCRPNTGLLMMDMLINKNIDNQIYITGFTFFKTPYVNGIRDKIDGITEKSNNVSALNRMKNAGHHNQENQIEYFKKITKNNKNQIYLDSTLESICKIKF